MSYDKSIKKYILYGIFSIFVFHYIIYGYGRMGYIFNILYMEFLVTD